MTADVAALRGAVLELIGEYDDAGPGGVVEPLESLRVAWLIHTIEQRYSLELELTDLVFEQLSTVDGVASLLSGVLGGDRDAAER